MTPGLTSKRTSKGYNGGRVISMRVHAVHSSTGAPLGNPCSCFTVSFDNTIAERDHNVKQGAGWNRELVIKTC